MNNLHAASVFDDTTNYEDEHSIVFVDFYSIFYAAMYHIKTVEEIPKLSTIFFNKLASLVYAKIAFFIDVGHIEDKTDERDKRGTRKASDIEIMILSNRDKHIADIEVRLKCNSIFHFNISDSVSELASKISKIDSNCMVWSHNRDAEYSMVMIGVEYDEITKDCDTTDNDVTNVQTNIETHVETHVETNDVRSNLIDTNIDTNIETHDVVSHKDNSLITNYNTSSSKASKVLYVSNDQDIIALLVYNSINSYFIYQGNYYRISQREDIIEYSKLITLTTILCNKSDYFNGITQLTAETFLKHNVTAYEFDVLQQASSDVVLDKNIKLMSDLVSAIKKEYVKELYIINGVYTQSYVNYIIKVCKYLSLTYFDK